MKMRMITRLKAFILFLVLIFALGAAGNTTSLQGTDLRGNGSSSAGTLLIMLKRPATILGGKQ